MPLDIPPTNATGAPAPLQSTITIKLAGASYEFRIPTLHDEIRIGAKMRTIAGIAAPDAMLGNVNSLDNMTAYTLRALATFEELLVKSDATWPWSQDPSGKVICNSATWPADKANVALDVYAGFTDELGKFRTGVDARPPQ
jgi:hypothetical protein